MARNKMKKYKFSDEVVAKDAIISLVFGVISFICIAYAVIYAFVVHGKAPEAEAPHTFRKGRGPARPFRRGARRAGTDRR